jgi:hypothetical protein
MITEDYKAEQEAKNKLARARLALVTVNGVRVAPIGQLIQQQPVTELWKPKPWWRRIRLW